MTDIEYRKLTSHFSRRIDSPRRALTDKAESDSEFGWGGLEKLRGSCCLGDKPMTPIDSETKTLLTGAVGYAK